MNRRVFIICKYLRWAWCDESDWGAGPMSASPPVHPPLWKAGPAISMNGFCTWYPPCTQEGNRRWRTGKQASQPSLPGRHREPGDLRPLPLPVNLTCSRPPTTFFTLDKQNHAVYMESRFDQQQLKSVSLKIQIRFVTKYVLELIYKISVNVNLNSGTSE